MCWFVSSPGRRCPDPGCAYAPQSSHPQHPAQLQCGSGCPIPCRPGASGAQSPSADLASPPRSNRSVVVRLPACDIQLCKHRESCCRFVSLEACCMRQLIYIGTVSIGAVTSPVGSTPCVTRCMQPLSVCNIGNGVLCTPQLLTQACASQGG